uniref:Putative conserved plasma membrane protein n=1 Tax=Culex tarsalis TaxID=7177 RepID=A0A1Q3F8S7_CULTA
MGTNFSLNQSLSSLSDTTMKTESTTAGTTLGATDNHYPGNSESLNFLFIPLAVLITVMLLSVMVYLMSRRKHKIFAKHPYVPSFTFDTSDIEDDDDLETEHLLKGKLRLDEPYFKGINSSKTYATNGNELYA